VCDWNDDGRKDLLVGQEGISAPCNVYVYLNEGSDSVPEFGDSTSVLNSGSPINSWRCAAVLEDLDRDGVRDLILGEWYSSVRFYRNTGTNANPAFSGFINLVPPDPDSFSNGNPPRLNLVDWDGDADLDMVTCDYYGSVFLRRNVTPTGTVEQSVSAGARPAGPTVVRNNLRLAGAAPAVLLDASGRRVLSRGPGLNDVSRLRPGVYFMRAGVGGQGSGSSSRKVVIAR
jgi:hypothetical protein